MVFNQAGAYVNSLAFAANQLNLLFSLSAGNYLTRVHLEGIQNAAGASGAISTATTLEDDFVGGIQYGAAGYGGHALTTGDTTGASWLTWGDVSKGASVLYLLAGLSPQNATINYGRLISVDWRGAYRVPANQDFYSAFGTRGGGAFNFGVNFRWYAEWAS